MFLKNMTFEIKSAFYTLARELVSADGLIVDDEEKMMEMFLEEMEAAEDDLMPLSYEEAVNVLREHDDPVRRKIYTELTALAMADSDYDAKEKKFMNEMRERIGINKDIADELEKNIVSLIEIYDRIGNLLEGYIQ